MVGVEFYVLTSRGYVYVPPLCEEKLKIREAAFIGLNRPQNMQRC